ncbi:MAG: hypothetical protein ABEJ99_03530 [Candidatus Nanohaloarchaea archaeon]
MEQEGQYLVLLSALLLPATGTYLMINSTSYAGLIAAVTGLVAYLGFEYVSRESRKDGRTKLFRATLVLTKSVYEIILLTGLLSVSLIPKILAIAVLGSVAITEIFSLKLLDELRSKYRLSIGWNGRVGVILVSFLSYSFIENTAFIGAIIVLGVAIYDFSGLVLQLHRNLIR